MDDIEILDEIEPEEFYRSNKRECVEVDGVLVVKLTYQDGTVKHIMNLAVPTETLAGEPFEDGTKEEQ